MTSNILDFMYRCGNDNETAVYFLVRCPGIFNHRLTPLSNRPETDKCFSNHNDSNITQVLFLVDFLLNDVKDTLVLITAIE